MLPADRDGSGGRPSTLQNPTMRSLPSNDDDDDDDDGDGDDDDDDDEDDSVVVVVEDDDDDDDVVEIADDDDGDDDDDREGDAADGTAHATNSPLCCAPTASKHIVR